MQIDACFTILTKKEFLGGQIQGEKSKYNRKNLLHKKRTPWLKKRDPLVGIGTPLSIFGKGVPIFNKGVLKKLFQTM